MDDTARRDRPTRPHRWLALVGVSGAIGGAGAASGLPSPPATAATTGAPVALEARIAAARHQLRSATTLPPWVLTVVAPTTGQDPLRPEARDGPAGAWNNWPNWSNWANWANG
jgi:hypothetical protein